MRSALLALLALIAGQAFTCEAQPSFPIAGTVVYAETGAPMPRARVYLLKTGANQVTANATTGADGRFAFNLPQGSYELYAGERMLPQAYGLRTPEDRVPSSVITGPEQDTTHLVLRWFARGAIAGKVVDNDGEAVEGALVQLIRSGVVAGRRTNTTLGWWHTDDRGEYRAFSVVAGTYYVAVTAKPWYASGNAYLPAGQQDRPTVAFAPAYYPNTTDISQAAPLILKPGEEAHADIALTLAPGATITVNHDAPPEMRGTISLVREGLAGREAFQEQQNFNGIAKTYGLFGVPPGHYILRIAPAADGPQLTAEQPVDVNGSNVTVAVTLRPPPQVAGTVQFPEPGGKPRGTMLAVLSRADGTGSISATVGADGRFTFTRLAATQYKAGISLSGIGGYVASDIRVEGAAYRDGVIDLADGMNVTLRMTASSALGRVKGFATRDGKPVQGVMVILAPVPGIKTSATTAAFQTDSDGSYDWRNIRPGDYLLFATTDTLIEYQNPAAVQPYLSQAKPVQVKAKETYIENVPVVEAAGK